MGGRSGRVLRVGRPTWASAEPLGMPAAPLGAARGRRRGGRHHARGTSPIRSTWPSWARPWPPATPWSSSRPPTRRGAPRCSAGSSPRRPTSPPGWSTSCRRRTTPSGRGCCPPTRGSTRSASPGSTATGRRVMAPAAEHAQEGLPRARRQVGLRRPRRRRPARRRARPPPSPCAPTPARAVPSPPVSSCPGRSSTRPSTSTADALRKLPGRGPPDPGTICGPLISARQRDRVEGYIALARDEGGTDRDRRWPARRARPGVLRRARR